MGKPAGPKVIFHSYSALSNDTVGWEWKLVCSCTLVTMALVRKTAILRHVFFKMPSWQNSQDRRRASSDNISVIQKEFTKQAPVFENQWNQRMKRSNREIMDWVLNNLGRVSPHTRALDVASGTGIFARTLAPLCTWVDN